MNDEKRIHYMHSDEVLRIAKKMSDELPYLIQPSSTDVALAHLYAMYVYKPSLLDMTTEHIHNWNDTCDVRYTCPLQRKQECVCGATRYVEIPDSGIPVVKLSENKKTNNIKKRD